jgi:sigma-B regulation protein RsbU (phosphoserine phosphatase)
MVLDKGSCRLGESQPQSRTCDRHNEDERWLTLPNEPYTVRSALSIPICRGKVLMAVITLMHPDPGHFSSQTAQLMQLCAEQWL